MILSHRIGLVLLDRENRDASNGRDADRRFGVLSGKVGRDLDKLAVLAARLTRLGSRDLPLPAGLRRLDLPPAAEAAADMAWPVFPGSAVVSSPPAAAPASPRTGRDVLAALTVPGRAHEVAVSGPAPARAVAVAASAMRGRVARPSLPVADQETRRSSGPVMGVLSRSVLPRRDAVGPASRQRAPLVTVGTAVAARRDDRSASGGQDRRPTIPAGSLALHAAGRATGNGRTSSSIPVRPGLSAVAVSADRPGSAQAARMDVLRAAVPGPVDRELPGGLTSSPAARGLPPGMPEAGSTGATPHRLADLRRGVVSVLQGGSRQDMLRRQVIPPAGAFGRSNAIPIGSVTQGGVGSRQVAAPDAVAENGAGTGTGGMMTVNLAGNVAVEGRRLGQVVASSQARQASLPAYGPSRVNLRTVPIHSGMQIPQ